MYEARQRKEKVSRRIDAAGNGMTKQKKTIGIMQCLRSKVPDYDKKYVTRLSFTQNWMVSP